MALAVAFATPAAAGHASGYHAPKTPFGQPDFQGVWTNASMTGLERPADLSTLVVGPAEAAAYEKRRVERYAKEVAPVAPEEGAPPVGKPGQDASQCVIGARNPAGPPIQNASVNPLMQIVQTALARACASPRVRDNEDGPARPCCGEGATHQRDCDERALLRR